MTRHVIRHIILILTLLLAGRPARAQTTTPLNTELPNPQAVGDAMASPTVTPGLINFAAWWNGSGWDRARGDITNGLLVNVRPTTPAATSYLPVRVTTGSAFVTALDDNATDYATGGTTVNQIMYGLAVPSTTGPAAVTGVNLGGSTWAANFNLASAGGTAVTYDADTDGCAILSAATTNATLCKSSAGRFYGFEVYNTTTTTYYLRLYNLATAPTCSSATGFIRSIPIPPAPAAGQVSGAIPDYSVPRAFSAGFGYCITGGGGSTDNTNAAVGVYGEIRYK